MKQYLPRYVLGLLILLVLLGHSARFYQIPFINHLDALIYDTKVLLTMPQSMDERVAILDIDEKSLAEQGRWPWGRDKLATLMNKLFDQYGVKLVGFDVVFAEPDESSGLKSLESLAKKELKDAPVFQSALKDLRPQLDYDARFAAAVKNRPVILGYYFSSKEGGVSSGTAPEPVFPAGTFSGRKIGFTQWVSFGANLAEFQSAAAGARSELYAATAPGVAGGEYIGPDGIGEQRDFAHGFGDGFQALWIEREAVDHGLAEAVFLGTGEVEGVGG